MGPVEAALKGAPPDDAAQQTSHKSSKKAKKVRNHAKDGAAAAVRSGDGGAAGGAWGGVDVRDDFLVGLEEGGFMGLEVLAAPRMEATAGGTSLVPTGASAAADKPASLGKVGSEGQQRMAKPLLSCCICRPLAAHVRVLLRDDARRPQSMRRLP